MDHRQAMVLVQVHQRLVACDLVARHLVALLPEARRLTDRRLVACDLVAGHLVALLPEARRLTSQGILRQTSHLWQALPRTGEQTPSPLASSSPTVQDDVG